MHTLTSPITVLPCSAFCASYCKLKDGRETRHDRKRTNFLSFSCFSGTSSFKVSRRDCCVQCQKPDCCLIYSVQTFVEACLDWNRVPVHARVLKAELEERASIDIVRAWGRPTGRGDFMSYRQAVNFRLIRSALHQHRTKLNAMQLGTK